MGLSGRYAKAAGLLEAWIGRIMACVSGSSMSILWNGEKSRPLKPSRRLRHGDPMYLYLFVLCMERLCHLIDGAVEDKKCKPISLSRGGLKLSYICFADDLILFFEDKKWKPISLSRGGSKESKNVPLASWKSGNNDKRREIQTTP